ncbi:chemotaxis protein CheC [Stigmatella sp. ncwal1]|uniref:Chemotaxis protein CheC n=1 Tax=Stigmatella ashevillensis TaxID=2995309 RepID=A0ABT5DIQ3_9BACT|nr:chemotaxis protein CheC [Stigmatella ashevillena]MDC0713030.1 chemotaxis protein CheC [Stigmatella ashevillena]
MNALVPSEMQLDVLREVANIGCGHAANALARLVGGKRVNLSVPRAVMASAEETAERLGGDEPVVGARLGMEGELRGVMLFVLPIRDGAALGSVLLGQVARGAELESALSETANIVASACLSAIGKLTRWRLLPTVPEMLKGSAREVVASAVKETEGGQTSPVVVLEARFSADCAPPVSGQMLLVLDREGSKALLHRLGV